jgi:uncharacterized damage-inducible protein DinB
MESSILARVFEHNNWANKHMIKVCSELSDLQLDSLPQTATRGTIRETLIHLATAQRNYLSLLTRLVEERTEGPVEFSDLPESMDRSGGALLQLARDEGQGSLKSRVRTSDGYDVEPWIVMLQTINHACEHREQISSMLTSLGVTPPDLDSWEYGEAAKAVVRTSK